MHPWGRPPVDLRSASGRNRRVRVAGPEVPPPADRRSAPRGYLQMRRSAEAKLRNSAEVRRAVETRQDDGTNRNRIRARHRKGRDLFTTSARQRRGSNLAATPGRFYRLDAGSGRVPHFRFRRMTSASSRQKHSLKPVTRPNLIASSHGFGHSVRRHEVNHSGRE